jgi:hypothetical protein
MHLGSDGIEGDGWRFSKRHDAVGRHAAVPLTGAVETARPRHGDLKDRHSRRIAAALPLTRKTA